MEGGVGGERKRRKMSMKLAATVENDFQRKVEGVNSRKREVLVPLELELLEAPDGR